MSFRHFILTVLVCVLSSSFITTEPVVHELAFNLMPSTGGGLNTFALVSTKDGEIVNWRALPQRQFILIATGAIVSNCNPNRVDFFEEFDIPNCSSWYDRPFSAYRMDCPTIKNLWRLRYSKWPDPGVTDAGAGWSNGQFAPTESQMMRLSEFGIQDLDDFAIGNNCFRLIKATTDPAWRGLYN